MSVKNVTERAVKKINQSIEQSLSQSELDSVTKIIKDGLITAIKESVQNCSNKAAHCCGPESDMAHKMAKEFQDAQKALIANLTSMR